MQKICIYSQNMQKICIYLQNCTYLYIIGLNLCVHPHFEVPYPQLKRGQQTLGALVAVVRPFRYIYSPFLRSNTARGSCTGLVTVGPTKV